MCYHHRTTADPDQRDIAMSKEDLMKHSKNNAILKEVISKHFTNLEPHPVIEETCMQAVSASDKQSTYSMI